MKIKFLPESQETGDRAIESPNPAARSLPEWFKGMSRFTSASKQKPTMGKNGKSNLTVKNCPPFLDAMMFGYMATLPCDVQVKKISPQQYELVWGPNIDLIESHAISQSLGYPSESGVPLSALKWIFQWGIKTPPGYSILVTHPQNRFDLPFRTFSGVVDTDSYHSAVNFPFEMVDHLVPDGEFIIPAGTPIAQIIPFRRDKWESEVTEFDESSVIKNRFELKKILFKSYKRQYWKKKSFL